MTDFAYGFRRRTASGELDGFSLEQLNRNVETRDVDSDVGRMSPGVDGLT